MRLNDFQLTENFNLKEFECPCCHTVLLHPLLVLKLQKLRDEWGLPLIINSGISSNGIAVFSRSVNSGSSSANWKRGSTPSTRDHSGSIRTR